MWSNVEWLHHMYLSQRAKFTQYRTESLCDFIHGDEERVPFKDYKRLVKTEVG